jgi:biotin operon repressor
MSMRRKVCCECNKSLKKDEIALSKKLLGKEIEEFYCVNCLADHLECSTVDLLSKIQEFKEQGCTLFL